MQSETVLPSPSEYARTSSGMLTWSEGGLSVSLITSRIFLKYRQKALVGLTKTCHFPSAVGEYISVWRPAARLGRTVL